MKQFNTVADGATTTRRTDRAGAADIRQVALWIARPAVAVAIIGLWIAYVDIGDLPSYFLPHPVDVLRSFSRLIVSGEIWPHVAATAAEALLGFLLGTSSAVAMGTLISRSPFVESTIRPYIIASQTTPIIVLAPLFLVWFGFGLLPKVLIAAIVCFFPLLVNVMAGLSSVSETERRLFRSLEASRWQTFIYLEVPRALPFIFAGLRITCVLSIIGAVVGEFVGARAGLGYLALTAAGNLQTEVLFSAVIALMILGVSFYTLVGLLERKLLFWNDDQKRR